MKFENLRTQVCEANKEIDRAQLAILTWGNVSAVDRAAGVFAIKPSGVEYDELTPGNIPVVSIETGRVVEGTLNPSSDTDTHRLLYQSFTGIGAVAHTHSPHATAWAQAQRAIPCLGTTHADTFAGPVPCTRSLTRAEVENHYEHNTGAVIVAHFKDNDLDPVAIPGVLVSAHAPFAWGKDAMAAVTHARILEEVARIAAITLGINPGITAVDQYLLDKHYYRKHGKNAYYGQEKE